LIRKTLILRAPGLGEVSRRYLAFGVEKIDVSIDKTGSICYSLSMEFILTEATCGAACWHAREEVCRCSCGGKNHGCLKSDNGVQPTRTAKIDGVRYELRGVGGDVEKEAMRLNKEAGISYFYAHTARQHYGYTPVALMRPATPSQMKWPELKAERERIATLPAWRQRSAYLLWVRIDPIQTKVSKSQDLVAALEESLRRLQPDGYKVSH
jgi:hypothetical protein